MLFLSHSKDRLADRLAEQLFDGSEGSPLRERWIVLSGEADRQWVQIALTERSPKGAIAGLQIFTWVEALSRVCHPVPTDFELRLALFERFSRELPPSFHPLQEWLKGGHSRLDALIRILSRQMREVGLYGMGDISDWQRDLYRMLTLEGPWRFPLQLLQEGALPSHVQEIHCFCLDEMPQMAWDVLLRSGKVGSICLFSPCQLFWEDLLSDRERCRLSKQVKQVSRASFEAWEEELKNTHPLLANWGRLGRRVLHLLEPYSLELFEEEEQVEGNSLLERVQRDLLLLRTLKDEPSLPLTQIDASLEIARVGSSRLREVEVLREKILRFLSSHQATLSDVLVLAPDICVYERLIQFVFGRELPHRIAPIDALVQNDYCQAILQIFDLATERWEVDDVLKLFENRSFQEKQRLSAEDLTLFREWLEEAGIRGSWKEYKGNWTEGLQRMLCGLLYLLPEEKGPPRIRSIDWGQAEALDRFFFLMQRIQFHVTQFLPQTKQALHEWGALLESMAAELFAPEEGHQKLFRAFLRKISMAASSFPKMQVPFSCLRSLFEDDCRAASGSYQAHSLETIQFASLEVGAIRPARAVFLLGMDAESFPRKERESSFHWNSSRPSSSDRDRYLLLQVLFAAKDQLTISYCHLSSEDGKSVEISLPIQELLDLIDRYYISSPTLIHTDSPAPIPAQLRASPFWPEIKKERAGVCLFDLADFSLLARHPWKYFLKRTLGVFLKEEKLFREQRLQDFSLPAYREQRWLKASLGKSIEEILEQESHHLPPGQFGVGAAERVKRKKEEWDSFLDEWGIVQEEISSVEIAPIHLSLPGQLHVQITGTLEGVVSGGLLTLGDTNHFFTCLKEWPALLLYLASSKKTDVSLYSLSKGRQKQFKGIDVNRALHRWIEYALQAEESLSPLIEPWAEAFLRKGREGWEKTTERFYQRREDETIQWVLQRAEPLPLEEIWSQWRERLLETFKDLVGDSHESI